MMMKKDRTFFDGIMESVHNQKKSNKLLVLFEALNNKIPKDVLKIIYTYETLNSHKFVIEFDLKHALNLDAAKHTVKISKLNNCIVCLWQDSSFEKPKLVNLSEKIEGAHKSKVGKLYEKENKIIENINMKFKSQVNLYSCILVHKGKILISGISGKIFIFNEDGSYEKEINLTVIIGTLIIIYNISVNNDYFFVNCYETDSVIVLNENYSITQIYCPKINHYFSKYKTIIVSNFSSNKFEISNDSMLWKFKGSYIIYHNFITKTYKYIFDKFVLESFFSFDSQSENIYISLNNYIYVLDSDFVPLRKINTKVRIGEFFVSDDKIIIFSDDRKLVILEQHIC
jgi:hypothetical protein